MSGGLINRHSHTSQAIPRPENTYQKLRACLISIFNTMLVRDKHVNRTIHTTGNSRGQDSNCWPQILPNFTPKGANYQKSWQQRETSYPENQPNSWSPCQDVLQSVVTDWSKWAQTCPTGNCDNSFIVSCTK